MIESCKSTYKYIVQITTLIISNILVDVTVQATYVRHEEYYVTHYGTDESQNLIE